jgi:hypothetical protein
MKMGDYQAVIAYFGVAFIVFLGGILWAKRRQFVMRMFHLREYRSTGNDDSQTPTAPTAHAQH